MGDIDEAADLASEYMDDGDEFVVAVGRAAREFGLEWKEVQEELTYRSAQKRSVVERGIYNRYLKSPEWAITRAAAISRAGHRCEYCESDYLLEAHHLTYKRLGREEPRDLLVLCKACHKEEHGEDGDLYRDIGTRAINNSTNLELSGAALVTEIMRLSEEARKRKSDQAAADAQSFQPGLF